MTIRRALRGWFTYLRVGLVLVGVLAFGWHDNGYNHTFRVSVLAVLITSVCTLFAFGFRCPRCRSSLVHKAPTILMKGCQFACPNCGVSVDEPRDSTTHTK